MDKNSQAFKFLKTTIELFSKIIGPESCLNVPTDDQYTFHDNLKYTKFYFQGGSLLRELVLEKIESCKDQTNEHFSFKLFEVLMNEVYKKIKGRKVDIEKPLNNYLIEEDFDFVAERLEEILKNSNGTFKVMLVSDLIELKDIEFYQIGKVEIKKITKDYVDMLPREIESYKGFSILFASPGFLTREEFFEKHKEHVVLQLEVKGFHLENEKSAVFDSAIREIRLVFAYLVVCKYFLENVAKEQYKIEVKKIKGTGIFWQADDSGLQEYYIINDKNVTTLKKIDTRWEKIIISKEVLVLSKELIEKLEGRCYLKQFNEMNQNDENWEIKNKINKSFDWFLKANFEEDLTDTVIGLFISLESLLATGSDFLTSHTDDMAENIAMMLTRDPEERYKYKRRFKDCIYPLRNKIMHHGNIVSWDKDWEYLADLRIYTTWSILGILKRLKDITIYGKKGIAIREYFDREKLK